MNCKIFISLFVLSLLFVSCTKDLTEADMKPDEETCFDLPEEYEPGWVRVKFTHLDEDLNTVLTRNGEVFTGIPELDEVAAALGATKIERVFNEGGKFKERRRKYGLHLWYDFYVGEEQPITRSMGDFAALPFVEIVELIPVDRQTAFSADRFYSSMADYKFFGNPAFAASRAGGDGFKFNDPLLSRQWHYYNDGSTASSIAGADANIFPAWTITTGDPRVIVAVVDGGIDFNHPDLARNMWINTGEIAGNGIDDDDNGYIDDIYGFRWGRSGIGEPTGEIFPMDHGSHCAGTIAAVNNNGVGLAGVAGGNGDPNTGIRLMSCQTYVPDPEFPDDPYGNSKSTSQTPDAFAYAADNGAVIANCSFSYSGTSLSSAYKAGIDYFVDHAGIDENGNQTGPMKGGLMVASAGNDGQMITKYPASYERCISVAYSMSNYKKSTSSNYGPWIDVTAPGGATSSSYAPGRVGGVFSTIPMQSGNFDVEKGYGYKSGTSMAAPHVAGIAALILSAAVENDIPMTVEKLRDIIERSCWDIEKYNPEYKGMMGHGQVDAHYALQILLGPENPVVPPPADVNATAAVGSISLFWNVPADAYGTPVSAFEVYFSDKSLNGVDLNQPPAGVTKDVIENDKPVGSEHSKSFFELEAETEYYMALIAVDRQGIKSAPVFISEKTKEDELVFSGNPSFKLFPSPVKDKLYIRLEGVEKQDVGIEIFNSTGMRILKENRRFYYGTSIPFDFTKLSGGAYTVVLKYDGKVQEQTIMKY